MNLSNPTKQSYALAHASRFVRPSAVRIASSEEENGIESVAFQNADDQSIALIVLNSSPFVRDFSVRPGKRNFAYQLQPGSAASFVWLAKLDVPKSIPKRYH